MIDRLLNIQRGKYRLESIFLLRTSLWEVEIKVIDIFTFGASSLVMGWNTATIRNIYQQQNSGIFDCNSWLNG